MAEFDVGVYVKADEDHLNMDKENIHNQIIPNKSAEINRSASCPRTPLQSINQDRDGIIHPVYSPVTPVSGKRSQRPHVGHKSKTPQSHRKTACGARAKPSPLNLMNTLLYNKAKELIDQGLQEERDRRKELEALLTERDEEILRLKAEVSLLNHQPVGIPVLQDEKSIATCYKLSSLDYSKRAEDELVTGLKALGIHNVTLCSEYTLLSQKNQLLEQELVQMRTITEEGRVHSDNAFEQAKVSYEQRIAELLTHQSHLVQEVSEHEKEVASCRNEMQQREKEVMMLSESLAKLQDDLLLTDKQKQQLTELCDEYRSQHQQDIERLQKLQAELDEYAKIRPNIIKARQAQVEFAAVVRKAHKTVMERNRALAAEKEEFLKQKVEWLKWKDEKEGSLTAAEDEHERILEEKQIQDKRVEKHRTEQLASAESRIDDLLSQVVCLEASLENEKGIRHDLTEKLNLAEKRVTDISDQLAADVERHELEVTNLQRTLDMRDNEADELTKECNNFQRLVTHLKAQVTKQLSIISKVIDLEKQIELLEKEKMAVCDEMLELRRKSTESQQKLRQLTADHKALKDELQLQTEKAQSFETCLVEKEQQILTKEAELTNAVHAVELLCKRSSSFFDNLTSQWRAWNKVSQGMKRAEEGTPNRRRSQARTPVASARRMSRKSFGTPSFVYQILSASKQNPVATNAEPHGSAIAPILKIYEGKSAQDHAASGPSETDPIQKPELEMPQLTIRRHSQDSTGSDGADIVSLHSSSSSSSGERFTGFLNEIATIFAKMESLLHGEVAVAFSRLRNLVKLLESRLSQQQQTHTKQMTEARLLMHQAVAEAGEAERRLQIAILLSTNLEDELKEKTEQVNQLTALLREKNEKLMQLLDQSFEIQKLSEELASALKRCELRDEENRLLRLSFGERLQRIEANSDNSLAVFKEMEEDLITLKIRKEKLMQESAADRRKWEESVFKLEERHRTDLRNIRKAEEAIGQLDDKIERIRVALLPHVNILKTDEKLYQVLQEIRALD